MTSTTWRRAAHRARRRGWLALAAGLLATAVASTTPTAGASPADHTGNDRHGQVDNAYAGAAGYVNPQYAANVRASARQEHGRLGASIRRLASVPTAVWLDRIAAVTGGPGVTMTLRDHLEAALDQQRRTRRPVAITLVVYNLPNRDCAAAASAGELLVAEDGEARYRAEFVDQIASILGERRYAGLRKVAILEPDSLPNMVTNLAQPRCAEADAADAYVEGIQYALDRLHPIRNTYAYLDIAHAGWLGWDPNFPNAVSLYTEVVAGTDAGFASVDGLVTNVSNYVPTEEVFLPDPNLDFGGLPLRSNSYHQWNPFLDELDYAQGLRSAFVAAGFPDDIGMLVDTGRNGWGGPNRPAQVSTATDLEAYVAESRIDRRPARSGWCNQAGAGIGTRPQAGPAVGIDAFVWIKPPGESDGVSAPGIPDPNDPNKGFDPNCDPNGPTNALPDAPHAGRWFHEQLVMLVRNAHPAL